MADGPLASGSLVAGRFRLEDLLEEHAGARLWRAVDLTLARNVAVHVIPGDDLRAEAALTAARTSATVSDGRILRVLDAVREGDHVSVVHEWGSGLSLDRLVAEEPLAARRAAWLVREVADAIAVAHRHGIAHGRLLPEQVMVNDAGSVKLIGFVVDAALRGRADARSAAAPSATGAAAPLGEHECDVRNLGALLYAGLTGKWPGTPGSTLPPAPTERGSVCRPRQVRSGVPRALDELCDQLLNQSRPEPGTVESAAQVSDLLSDFLGEAQGNGARAARETASDVEPTTLLPRGSGEDPDATQAWRPHPVGAGAGAGAGARASSAVLPEATPAAPAWEPRPVGDRPPPPRWGPDRTEERTGASSSSRRGGAPWLTIAAGLGLLTLLVLTAVVAMNLRPPSQPDPAPQRAAPGAGTGAPSSKVVEPAAVRDFDPDQTDGAPEEHSELVPLATDGDRATAWRTLTYTGGPQLAPYKRGVGLLVDLGRELPVAELDATLVGEAYDVELLAAPPGAGPPTDITGLREAASETGVAGRVRLRPAQVIRTRYLVLWLTALPNTGSGYAGQVAEVVVRS